MFIFDPDYTFEWPVTVRYPGAGEEVEASFTGVFRLPEDELEIYGQTKARTVPEVIQDVRERLARYWIGWTDIETKAGGQLPYSDETRDRLLRQRPIREAVDRALSEGIMGIREKN